MLELNIHHKTIAEKLKRKKEKTLVRLCIPAQDKDFVRVNKKEFIWQGQWYDIDEIQEKNGMYEIIAHPDKKEKELQEKLNQALEHEQEQSEKSKKSPKFELKETYAQKIEYLFLPCFNCYQKGTLTISIIHNLSFSLLKPPPEFLG